jgi:hypothetical protein
MKKTYNDYKKLEKNSGTFLFLDINKNSIPKNIITPTKIKECKRRNIKLIIVKEFLNFNIYNIYDSIVVGLRSSCIKPSNGCDLFSIIEDSLNDLN